MGSSLRCESYGFSAERRLHVFRVVGKDKASPLASPSRGREAESSLAPSSPWAPTPASASSSTSAPRLGIDREVRSPLEEGAELCTFTFGHTGREGLLP